MQLENHPYFTKFTDPQSGVESYLLTEKIAGMYQHFYFSESSVTKDGKYLWICCTYPPSWFVTLAVVSLDPENPFIRHFPHAGVYGELPCITPEQDGVYYPNNDSIYKVDLMGNVTKVFQLDPDFVKKAVEMYGSAISVGIDSKDGKVKVAGWIEDTDTDYLEFAKLIQECGIKNIIVTDISRDGTLEGVNVDMIKTLSENLDIDITASGGVNGIDDIKALSEIGIYGVIAGKSLYRGTLDLEEAIKIGRG